MNPAENSPNQNNEFVTNPLSLLDDILKKLPSIALPDLPPDIPEIIQYKKPLIDMIHKVGAVLSPKNLEKMLSDEFLGMLLKLHSAVDDLEHNTLVDWMGAELEDFLTAAESFVEMMRKEVAADTKVLMAKINSIASSVHGIAEYWSVELPFDAYKVLADAEKLIPQLPAFVLNKLDDLLSMELRGLRLLADKLKPKTSVAVIVMASAAATLRAISAVLKLFIRALPINLKFGLNLAIEGTAIGRGSAQADISAGVDVGVGASVPIAGIGGDAGAGGGNSSVFSTTPLTISLTGLVIGPLAAACDSAVAVLEAIIKIEKKAS